jgi:hypothetical protein
MDLRNHPPTQVMPNSVREPSDCKNEKQEGYADHRGQFYNLAAF